MRRSFFAGRQPPVKSGSDAPTCFVHIGTHKTGTTAIQRFCAANADALLADGLHYPHAGRWGDWAPGHHNMMAELLRYEQFTPSNGTVKDVIAEIAGAGADRVCLSSEGLHVIRRDDRAMTELRDALTAIGYRPHIVLYVRAQEAYVESLYATLAVTGLSTRRFAEFLDQVVRDGMASEQHGTYTFEYSALAERFARVFGSEAITVRGYVGYDSPMALVRDFLKTVGSDERLADGEGVSQTTYENVRPTTGTIVRALYRFTGKALGDDRTDAAGAELVAGAPADASMPFRPLSPELRRHVSDRFADDNALVVRRWHVDPATFAYRAEAESAQARSARALFAAADASRT